jgi:hypothetical protein
MKPVCSIISFLFIVLFIDGCVSVPEPSPEKTDNRTDVTEKETFGTSRDTTTENPVTEEEILLAEHAISRAEEIHADSHCPDQMKLAREAFHDALDLQTTDPGKTRALLKTAREKADDAFAMTADMLSSSWKKRLDAMLALLTDIEADTYALEEYRDYLSRIEEVDTMFEEKNITEATLLAEKTEEKMKETYKRIDTQITLVMLLKQDAENALDSAEKSDACIWVEEAYMLAHDHYFAGMTACRDHHLDEAEENFRHTVQLCENSIAQSALEKTRHSVSDMKTELLDMLQEASELTVATEELTLIEPQSFDREIFLKEIELDSVDRGATGEDKALPGGEPEIPVENLLDQSKKLVKQGVIEEKKEDYTKAEQLFIQAKEYLTRYKRHAVKTIYTVRYLPQDRDCLWNIAGYDFIYGNPFLWPLIWRRNRNLLKNPRFIRPGQRLIIPLKPAPE